VTVKPAEDALMNPREDPFSKISEQYWDIIIVVTSGIILFLTFYCLLAGITTVFMHLYYFPIILLAYRYQKKGVVYSVILSVLYFLLVLWFQHSQVIEIAGALLRVLSFTAVAVVVAYLSIIISRKQQEYLAVSLFNESIVSSAKVWLTVVDTNGNIHVWNRAAEDITGYSAGEVTGKNTVWKYLYPDHDYRKGVTDTITTILKEMKFFENFETVIVAKDGENKTISWNTRAIPDTRGVYNRFVAIGIDITGRKQAEKDLEESESRFHGLFDNMSSGVAVYEARRNGEDFIIKEINPAVEKIENIQRQDIIGRSVLEVFPGVKRFGFFDVFQRVWRTGVAEYYPVSMYRDDRIAGWRENYVYKHSSGEIVAIYDDVTTRKRAEEALKESEDRYRNLFASSRDAIMTLEPPSWRFTSGNPATVQMFKVKDEAEFTSREPWALSPEFQPDGRESGDKAREMIETAMQNGTHFFEWTHKRQSGEDFPATVLLSRVELPGKVFLQATVRDITEYKMMTGQIEASLAEKEILLKEVHHRVKNNLQIIASLLNLQIRKITDPATIEAIKDSQSRVRSMALVHEHLYRGKDFSHIDLGNYIRALGTVLSGSSEAGNHDVRFDFNIHDIYVDTNTAIPLGLICNELITNSLKYAFDGRKDKKLSITAAEDPVALTFIVADNGTGMPEGITLENQASLGLQLVGSLIDQLNGTVTIDRTGGTKFVFTIPKPAEQKPSDNRDKVN
jgi:PAS domain S-box-containing protein